jgi:signal transduction histidine kinase
VREIVSRAVERGEAFELTYRIRTRAGTVKWVWERGRAVPGPDGTVRSLEGFITDITERKLLESQVLQNQRLESIGTLAGGIAHDLNNVFAPIMMAGDLLADKEPDADSSQLLNVIAASARRGAELVRQILLFARGMEGPRVAVNPNSLFARSRPSSTARFRSPSGSTIHVAPGCAGDLRRPRAAPPGAPQPFRERARRDARRRPPRDHGLECARYRRRPRGPTPTPCPARFVRIDVSDTGCGIPDILKGQIFDPFFTTKGVGRGSGLGLSTARAIVKAHCGFITFVSTEGDRHDLLHLPAHGGSRALSPHTGRGPEGDPRPAAPGKGREHSRRRRRGVGAPHHAQHARELRLQDGRRPRTAPRPWRS